MAAAKILIVEDEGLVGLELTQVLKNMGYEVPPVVTSGTAALKAAAGNPPDLILMDIRLDGCPDGIETAIKIREEYAIPVIYLTAYADENTIQRAKLTESYGYLIKPFEERSLRAAIEVALHKARSERTTREKHDLNRVIIEDLAEGIIITDPAGKVKYVNTIARSMTGLAETGWEDELLSRLIMTFDPEKKMPLELPVSRVSSAGEVIVAEGVIIRGGSGETVGIEYTMAPLKNREGDIAGIVFMMKDISGRQKTAKAVQFELESSKKYQLNLLPEKDTRVHGVRADWLFHPSIYGSGDVFNLFPLSAVHTGFYLLDVMGHGFSAAVLSVTIYSFLSHDIARMGILRRAQSSGIPSENGATEKNSLILRPGEVIRELNSRFFFKANDNPFFTLVYGVIDTEKRKGVLARAGHPYPLLIPKTGDGTRLNPNGQAIGVFPEISVEEKEFDFRTGARLFLYSDGLVDLFQSHETPSDEALVHFLKKNNHMNLNEICGRLDERIRILHPDVEFADDITFFALESVEEETSSGTDDPVEPIS